MMEIFVYPGQIAFAKEASRIRTILGSCVSVVLWDEQSAIGGLCHYLLPEPTVGNIPSPRYGSFAIPELLAQMLKAGAHKDRISAKIYGGGNVVNHLNRVDGTIGMRNIEVAKSLLQSLHIKVLEENIGGTKGRWIELDTRNFQVAHRFSDENKDQATLSGTRLAQVKDKIKVLIIDDSATVRTIFQKVLSQSANIEVVGTATDPYDAREKIIALKPDVITLDIEMPKMNGVVFLEKLMTHHPIPVIMVSSLGADGEAAQRALELGAVEFVQKPSQFDPSLLSDLGETLIHKVIAASTAKVHVPKAKPKSTPNSKTYVDSEEGSKLKGLNLVVIGGNVGSADFLATLINGLAPDTPPVVVSISTISSFIGTYTQRLQKTARVELQILRQTETPLSMGKVYFATADSHVLLKKSSSGSLSCLLEKGNPFFGQRPSSEKLFLSAAEATGGSLCAILLSSFSADGVNGLLKVRESGGVTLVQNPDETPFNATPATAIEKGAASYILRAEEMPALIMQLRNKRVLLAS